MYKFQTPDKSGESRGKLPMSKLLPLPEQSDRGSFADQGVRPTAHSDFQSPENAS